MTTKQNPDVEISDEDLDQVSGGIDSTSGDDQFMKRNNPGNKSSYIKGNVDKGYKKTQNV